MLYEFKYLLRFSGGSNLIRTRVKLFKGIIRNLMLCARGFKRGKLINWIGKRVVGSCTELFRSSKGLNWETSHAGNRINLLFGSSFLRSYFLEYSNNLIIQIGSDVRYFESLCLKKRDQKMESFSTKPFSVKPIQYCTKFFSTNQIKNTGCFLQLRKLKRAKLWKSFLFPVQIERENFLANGSMENRNSVTRERNIGSKMYG